MNWRAFFGFGRKAKPAEPRQRVWAHYDYGSGVWAKVVSPERPTSFMRDHVQGPFRSEVDAEEFCTAKNKGNMFLNLPEMFGTKEEKD